MIMATESIGPSRRAASRLHFAREGENYQETEEMFTPSREQATAGD
jgi:hypothetical protein